MKKRVSLFKTCSIPTSLDEIFGKVTFLSFFISIVSKSSKKCLGHRFSTFSVSRPPK